MFFRYSLMDRVVSTVAVIFLTAPFAAVLIVVLGRTFEGAGVRENFVAVITRTPIVQSTLNSATIAAGTIAVVLVCTLMAGFAFSKMRFYGKSLLFTAFLVGLVLPAVALIVPLFLFMQKLQLTNTFLAVILPLSATLIPFTLLLVRNYLNGIPDEIFEAARIDGCSSFSTMVRIAVPLSRPIIAVVIVWCFVQGWNEFFLPLLLLTSPELSTITTIPLYFSSVYGSDQPKIFTAIVIISIPVVLLYLAFQRFFEKGLSAGAIK